MVTIKKNEFDLYTIFQTCWVAYVGKKNKRLLINYELWGPLMVIDHVISKKNRKDIVKVSPMASLSEATKLLSQNKIGALPVTNDNDLILGILSERDIIKEIAEKGSSGLESIVENVMTSKVSTCGRFDTLKSVIERMNEGRFRHMPVTDNDKIIEFISISDLVLAHLNEVEYENDALKGSVTGNVRRQTI